MRKTLGICLLVLLLTGSVSAGEMPNWTPAPPPPANAVQDFNSTQSDGISLTEIVLGLLSLLP